MEKTENIFEPLSGYESLVASTQLLIKEVFRRGGEVEVIDAKYNLISIKLNKKQFEVLGTTFTHTQSLLNFMICNNKKLCKSLLQRHGFQTPSFEVINPQSKISNFKISFPVVVKPLETNHGIDVHVNLKSKYELQKVFEKLKDKYDELLLEEFIIGDEYRFLIIESKLVGIIKRIPSNLIGDGVHTLPELLKIKNDNRGNNYCYPLMKLSLYDLEEYMSRSKFPKDFVPKAGEHHQLTQISNLSKGGDSIDYTDLIPEDFKRIVVEVCSKFNLPFAGIDVIIPDLEKQNYQILEINERPMLSMHSFPFRGKNRKAEKFLLDHLLKNAV